MFCFPWPNSVKFAGHLPSETGIKLISVSTTSSYYIYQINININQVKIINKISIEDSIIWNYKLYINLEPSIEVIQEIRNSKSTSNSAFGLGKKAIDENKFNLFLKN